MTEQEGEIFFYEYIPTMRDDNKLDSHDTFATMLKGLDLLMTNDDDKNKEYVFLLETILEELKIEFEYVIEEHVTELMDIDEFFTHEFGELYEKYNHLFQ